MELEELCRIPWKCRGSSKGLILGLTWLKLCGPSVFFVTIEEWCKVRMRAKRIASVLGMTTRISGCGEAKMTPQNRQVVHWFSEEL